ncbi:MAG: aminoacyl-tRNA hydrolase [Clostridia bacterium]|nr:aminoacyl-tRNA hydrolase [Clostridia bacterium]
MKIIVGLGNPGKEYEKTNHNAGFSVVNFVCEKFSEKFSKKECDAEVAIFFVNGEKIVIAKPQTYMNNSGISVRKLVDKYKINPSEDLMIISDDFDTKEGTVRIRKQSGSTTHNGIRSIKQHLSTNEFLRVKVSIGSKPENMEVADFVLSKIKSEATNKAIATAVDAVSDFINGDTIEQIMQKYSK